MENARNSFYLVIRNQLALINPSRAVVLRGSVRPGVVVEENESAVAVSTPDIFVLRWTLASLDEEHVLPLATQACEIHYWTKGTSANGGLDRGRLLSAMDMELTQMLAPRSALKENFAITPALALATRVFWGGASFQPITTTKNQLSRVATVSLFSYEETVEL